MRSALVAGAAASLLLCCSPADPAPQVSPGAAAAAPGPSAGAGPTPGAPEVPPATRLALVECARERGLVFQHQAGFSADKQLPETMGAGAVLFDADNDGDLEIYCVQSGALPLGAARERSQAEPPNQLFVNDGRGHFEDATGASGAAADRGYGMGAIAGDVNADGLADLFVTNLGPDALLINRGACAFDDHGTSSGLADPRWNTGAVFFDADRDGDLDLYVNAYLEIDLEQPEWCGRREAGWRSYCHPDHYRGEKDRFYLNDGQGHFALTGPEQGIDYLGKGLGVIAGDFDVDGDLDLYTAHDSVENKLWENLGDGRFQDATLLSGVGVDGSGATEAGMGLASGDFDGDLDIDLIVTNFDEESNTLYANQGRPAELFFVDQSARAGIEAPSRPPVGFGVVFEDLDLDGDLDLAVTNGHIIDNIQLYNDGKRWKQRSQLFENDGRGRFVERHEEAGDFARDLRVGRGLYSGDLDGDGDRELVLTECGGPLALFDNRTQGRALVLEGVPQGARLVATLRSGRKLLREALPQTSYLGQGGPAIHLGLGAEDLVSALELQPLAGPKLVLGFDPPRGPGRARVLLQAERFELCEL